MRLWHAAGIRPVLQRPHARLLCHPQSLSAPLPRVSSLPLLLRHKSSKAQKAPKSDDEDKSTVDLAIGRILNILKDEDASKSSAKPGDGGPTVTVATTTPAAQPEGLTLDQFFKSHASESPQPAPKPYSTGKKVRSQRNRRSDQRKSLKPQAKSLVRQVGSSSPEDKELFLQTLKKGSAVATEEGNGDHKSAVKEEPATEERDGDQKSTVKEEPATERNGDQKSTVEEGPSIRKITVRSRPEPATSNPNKGHIARRLRRARVARAAHDLRRESGLPIRYLTSTPTSEEAVKASEKVDRAVKQSSPFNVAPSQSLKDALMGKTLEMGISNDNPEPLHKRMAANIETLKASDLGMTALSVEHTPVPRLNHGLDRVLFNRGVYQLQDPYSMVYNFDPYLQKIMPATEFDFNALAEYKTSSQDRLLSRLAKERNIKYVGSTSSMTSALGHFHYLLSNWRPIDISMLSKEFPETSTTFTEINRTPNAIFLRWKNGTYAIDADKEYDGANVLMLLGKSLEKLLTMPSDDFEKYRKSDPREISAAEREAPESFHYSTQGDILMRSQLDAHDPRLPGTGMFDLKTRAVVSIRMQSADYEEMSGYELHKQHGRFESYEREYYDMIRSTMLKYSLQARMGRMDGIFVAYHNVKRIFGFQYLNLNEMDRALHGQSDRCLGNQEFSLSIELLNKLLNKATEKFPNQSLRFHFETRPAILPFMYVFAEPMSDEDIDRIQNSQKAKIAEYERSVMGLQKETNEQATGSASDTTNEQATGSTSDATSEAGNETIKSLLSPDHHVSSDSTIEISTGTLKLTESGLWEETEADSSLARNDSPQETSTEESKEDPTYLTTDTSTTPADSDFIGFITPENKVIEENLRPLLAMTLTVRSKVNGVYVDRPEKILSEDDWKIEYSLSEISVPSRAWSLYEALKARRRKVFERLDAAKDDKDKDGNADEVSKFGKRGQDYLNMLRDLSAKGRQLRAEIDRQELEREKVVVGEPFDKADESTDSEKSHNAQQKRDERNGPAIKQGTEDRLGASASVDEYIGWLFSGRAGKDGNGI